MNATEVWREIDGHPGYEVSDQGQVRSYWTFTGTTSATPHLLVGGLAKGYRQVMFRDLSHRTVHSLVLEAFVGARPSRMVARHLNGKPLDNRASNLAWGTQRENIADRWEHGTMLFGERNPQACLTDALVREIRESREPERTIAARLGVSKGTIHNVRHRKFWKHVR